MLLATNRVNGNVFPYIKKCIDGEFSKRHIFNSEFISLVESRLKDIKHFLEPTLRSLENQTFKDFELIISHRYPEDTEEIVNKDWGFPIKLVKEKYSIWHDLGEQYHTVANNKNSAFINSSGELIYHIDDLTFFNENLLEEAWNSYKRGYYITGRTYRCITYDKDKYNYDIPKINRIGPNKKEIIHNGWKGEYKPLTQNHPPDIPMSMFWTCSASVSAKELLEINGYDELYDGSLTGIDMDAGNRLSKISKFKRIASETLLYEIDDPTPKNNIRDDVMMRQLMRVNHIKANSWKPNKAQINRYKRWHKHTLGKLDGNWNKFMLVDLYNIKRIE